MQLIEPCSLKLTFQYVSLDRRSRLELRMLKARSQPRKAGPPQLALAFSSRLRAAAP